MTPTRTYPEPATGPFPCPPRTATDGENRSIEIETLSGPEDAAVPGIVEMYSTFDPADRAQGIPPVRREDIEAWVEMVIDDGLDVIARHEDRVVGHATLVPENGVEYELAIFVHDAYQQAGIGTMLLESLLGVASTRGIEYVWLTVERWNTPAISLYESVGFETTESGSFEVEMNLRLDLDENG